MQLDSRKLYENHFIPTECTGRSTPSPLVACWIAGCLKSRGTLWSCEVVDKIREKAALKIVNVQECFETSGSRESVVRFLTKSLVQLKPKSHSSLSPFLLVLFTFTNRKQHRQLQPGLLSKDTWMLTIMGGAYSIPDLVTKSFQ